MTRCLRSATREWMSLGTALWSDPWGRCGHSKNGLFAKHSTWKQDEGLQILIFAHLAFLLVLNTPDSLMTLLCLFFWQVELSAHFFKTDHNTLRRSTIINLIDLENYGISVSKEYAIKHFIIKYLHNWLPVGTHVACYDLKYPACCLSSWREVVCFLSLWSKRQ